MFCSFIFGHKSKIYSVVIVLYKEKCIKPEGVLQDIHYYLY
jgi:hypothetical protein